MPFQYFFACQQKHKSQSFAKGNKNFKFYLYSTVNHIQWGTKAADKAKYQAKDSLELSVVSKLELRLECKICQLWQY